MAVRGEGRAALPVRRAGSRGAAACAPRPPEGRSGGGGGGGDGDGTGLAGRAAGRGRAGRLWKPCRTRTGRFSV